MCGINGVFGLADRELIKKMNNILVHRGPDDSGIYTDNDIMLGHRRLSIIDLSERGKQPMANEDGSTVIVYNGEIYNYQEIRALLEKKTGKNGKKYHFKSNTDTEVIIYAYEEFGERCVDMFNGMFAFAIWDSRDKKLFIARDRIGIKPLYYCIVDNVLLFSSEIKALLQYDQVKRELNRQSLYNFFNINYSPGEDTFFKGIKRLKSGHKMMVRQIKDKDGKHNGNNSKKLSIQIKEYWNIADIVPEQTERKSEDFYVKRLRQLMEGSVERHLISDVPFGAFLSAGIDSSTIVALMSRLANKPIKTYSVGFNEPWDELTDARLTAEELGTDHHEMIVESDSMRKYYIEALWHMDAPQRNIKPSMLVSGLAKKDVTVVQNGLGGDEIFAGYRRHRYMSYGNMIGKMIPDFVKSKMLNPLSKLPFSNEVRRGMKYLETSGDRSKNYVVLAPQVIYDENMEELGEEKFTKGLKPMHKVIEPYFPKKHDFFTQCLMMEMKTYLTDDLLDRLDKLTMARSVEGRVPFLDRNLVEFSFAVPNDLKLKNGTSKYILKKAMKDVLPERLLKRKKQGFNMDNYYWYKGGLGEIAKQLLTKENLAEEGLFKYDYVEKIMKKKPSPKMFWQYAQIWNLTAYELWRRMYIDPDKFTKPNFNIDKYL